MESERRYVSDRKDGPEGAPHILFADDEPPMRELVRCALEAKGYRVTTCCHAREAMGFFREHHDEIDLVIIDMLMPGMSGLDALKLMKSIDPTIRVILSSAYVPDQESDDVMLHGFADFLHKPFKTEDLAGIVARHVGLQAEVTDDA